MRCNGCITDCFEIANTSRGCLVIEEGKLWIEMEFIETKERREKKREKESHKRERKKKGSHKREERVIREFHCSFPIKMNPVIIKKTARLPE